LTCSGSDAWPKTRVSSNPVTLTPADFSMRRREGDRFVTSVLAGPRIWLVGDDASLAALA
jgi:hypothetical protein